LNSDSVPNVLERGSSMGFDGARTATAVKKTIIYLCTSKRV
jgi:hypothetical protein